MTSYIPQHNNGTKSTLQVNTCNVTCMVMRYNLTVTVWKTDQFSMIYCALTESWTRLDKFKWQENLIETEQSRISSPDNSLTQHSGTWLCSRCHPWPANWAVLLRLRASMQSLYPGINHSWVIIHIRISGSSWYHLVFSIPCSTWRSWCHRQVTCRRHSGHRQVKTHSLIWTVNDVGNLVVSGIHVSWSWDQYRGK